MRTSRAMNGLAYGLLNSVGVGALIAGSMLFSPPARAQNGPNDSAAAETVVVTGSQIQQAAGFVAPTPVTEISPVALEQDNLGTIDDLEGLIPQLTPNQATSVVTDPAASNFNLRNLGATRTLVMIDGLRAGPTSVNGTFDANTLPADLIQHIDVVTGGASAAYGSDAVAGVVGISLDDNLEGWKGKVSQGETIYKDDGTTTASLAYGTDFAGGRGHVVVAGDYYNSAGVLQQSARPWGRSLAQLSQSATCTTITSSCYELYRLTGATPYNISDGGNIVSAKTASGASSTALNNIMFGPGGVLEPFVTGTSYGTYDVGGSGSDQAEYMSLQPAVKRDNLFLHDSYDITDDLTVWSAVRYARTSEFTQAATNFNQANIIVSSQNAFIPAPLASLIAANNITSFTMSKSNFDIDPQGYDYGRYSTEGRNEVWNGSAGLKGKFKVFGTDWTWDAGAQYDSNYFDDQSPQEQNTSKYALAVDSILNPATGGVPGVAAGVPVCRSTIANPNNGCVPIDLFGPGGTSTAAAQYIMGTALQFATITMFDTAANLRGSPFSTWAGPVAVATGFEYRRQAESSTVDPTSALSDWRAGNNLPYAGHYSVEEGYLEVDTPLAKNLPLAEAVDVDTAARMTSYSTSGGVTTWKVGLNDSITDEFRIRGTRSHDIRAPDLSELYKTGATSFGAVIIDPRTDTTANSSSTVSGNPNLKPEIGDTTTAGIIYTPRWADSLNASVDYWNIKMTDVLSSQSAQQIVNNCFISHEAQDCSAVTLNSNGLIQQIYTTNFNAAMQKTNGIDAQVSYRFAGDDLIEGLGGTVMMNALGTYVLHYEQQLAPGAVIVDEAGCVGATKQAYSCGNPRLRWNLQTIWLSDPWTVSATANWISGGVMDMLYNPEYTSLPNAAAIGAETINNNHIDGQFTLNMAVSYQINNIWQIYVSGDNILNAAPPIVPDGLEFAHAFSNQIYDRLGAFWQAGIKLRLN